MKLPRVRLTVGRMMVIVGALGLAFAAERSYRRWQHGMHQPGYVRDSIHSSIVGGSTTGLVAGQPFAVKIKYRFTLQRTKPAPGTKVIPIGSVWLEDEATGVAVRGYTFDAPLVVGGREAAAGSFTWDVSVPRPGRYRLNHYVWVHEPGHPIRWFGGGSSRVVVASEVAGDPSQEKGEGER